MALSYGFSILLVVLLLSITIQDFRQMRIADGLNAAVFISGALYWLFARPDQLPFQIATAAAFGSALWLLREAHKRSAGRVGLGLGDVKLGAAGSVWLNPALLPFLLFTASASGLVFALAKSHTSGSTLRETRIPFGPFLCLAILVCWLLETTP